jgi:hypothetical protein
MCSETHVALHVKCLIFLSYFIHNWNPVDMDGVNRPLPEANHIPELYVLYHFNG